MNTTDEQFTHVSQHLGKSYIDSQENKLRIVQVKLFILLWTSIMFVGEEGIKVIFRKNYTITIISILRTLLLVICLGVIAFSSFYYDDSSINYSSESEMSDSRFVTGIIYIILTLTVILKFLFNTRRNSKTEKGESDILSFLKKDGWSEVQIQNIAEPILTLAIGIAYSFFDLLGGIPIVIIAFSGWFKILFRKLYSVTSLKDNIDSVNSESGIKGDFHQINC